MNSLGFSNGFVNLGTEMPARQLLITVRSVRVKNGSPTAPGTPVGRDISHPRGCHHVVEANI